MKAIERLKRDHAIIRSKLRVLESALAMGPETWFVLREVCFTLSRQLGDHIKREEALLADSRKALGEDLLARLEIEHRDEPEHLRTLNRLFVQERGRSLKQITPVLKRFIEGMQRHLEEEEMRLFPVLERLSAGQEPGAAEPAPTETPALNEVMTVNRIVKEFPRTQRVFEHLFINIPYEGCDCLDEVAWRHGMDSRELLERLETVISERPAAN
ncbi:MAG: hemerythrin domain-containing protein [Candidatus Omnitrophica bacterium]|nr:hemerythrin domain-containing protein [Candidatus Omnitrophota bacterium]